MRSLSSITVKVCLAVLVAAALAVPALASAAPSAKPTTALAMTGMTATTASAAAIIKQPGVASCLKKRFGAKVDARPEKSIVLFDPSGGSIVVDMPQAQEATLLFYRTMLEADRMKRDWAFYDSASADSEFVYRYKNVYIVFEHKPTKWEWRVIARCFPA